MLCALLVIDFADRQVVVTAFPYLRAEFAVSEAQLGALVSAVSVVVALGALPVALVVDRWSRVRAIAVMGSVWSGATAACAFAPGYLALLAARIGIGVGPGGFRPGRVRAARGDVSRRATSDRPERLPDGCAAGHRHRCGRRERGLRPVGVAVRVPRRRPARPGPRAAGAAAARLPQRPAAVTSTRGRRHAPAREVGPRRDAWGALLLVIFSTLYTWLPTHLERAYGMPPARAGVLASMVVLAGAVGTVSAGHVADRLARRDVRWRLLVPAVTAVATTAMLGTAFAAVPPGATQMVLILLGGATATTAIGPAAAVVLDVVPLGVRATAVSIFAVVQNLMGLAVGPVLTGALADRWGLTTALASWPCSAWPPGSRSGGGLGPTARTGRGRAHAVGPQPVIGHSPKADELRRGPRDER